MGFTMWLLGILCFLGVHGSPQALPSAGAPSLTRFSWTAHRADLFLEASWIPPTSLPALSSSEVFCLPNRSPFIFWALHTPPHIFWSIE